MAFKRIATVLALTSLTLAAGSAQAVTASFTTYVGDPTSIDGWSVWVGPSVARWQFSEFLHGALSIAQANVAGVAPGSVPASGLRGDEVHVDMPLRNISGLIDSDNLTATINRATFAGGVKIDVPAITANGRKNIASKGGSLSLSDFKIDFATKNVYVTLEGGNNVGIKRNQLLWNYDTLEGPLTVDCASGGGLSAGPCTSLNAEGLKVSGLHITTEAFDLVGASLGWTDFGKAAMHGVADYGTLTISAVPEVSPSWLALTGIAVLGVAARRRRAQV